MKNQTGRLFFTCEHARNIVPARYREVATRAGRALESHRGYDPGTLELGRELAAHFQAPWMAARYSRLLIELNRSPRHPALWSEFSQSLPSDRKSELLNEYYHPYRESIQRAMADLMERNRKVLHVGVHSFTPHLHGVTRNAEIGLLYDPARSEEKRMSMQWKKALRRLAPEWRVRLNYPYRGAADGLTTHLRKRFPANRYAGIELEVNQALVLKKPDEWKIVRGKIIRSLEGVFLES